MMPVTPRLIKAVTESTQVPASALHRNIAILATDLNQMLQKTLRSARRVVLRAKH